MKKSIAQNLFTLIEEAHFNEEGLELLSQLVNANVVSMTDPVSVNGHKDTLSHALLSLAEPGSQTLHFYTPQAAKQLLALDPKFFSHAYAGAGRLWLDYCLVAWSRSDDGSHFGFSTSFENPADQ